MKTFSTLALAFFLCCTASAQIRKAEFAHTKKADRLFDKWQYFEAAKLYEDAVKQNPSPELYYRLGQCYQKMFRFEDAAAAYDKVNASGTFSDPSFYLNYGLVKKY